MSLINVLPFFVLQQINSICRGKGRNAVVLCAGMVKIKWFYYFNSHLMNWDLAKVSPGLCLKMHLDVLKNFWMWCTSLFLSLSLLPLSLYSSSTQQSQRQNIDLSRQAKFASTPAFALFVTLKNVVCKIGEDAEVLMSLYDPVESKFIRWDTWPKLLAARWWAPLFICRGTRAALFSLNAGAADQISEGNITAMKEVTFHD